MESPFKADILKGKVALLTGGGSGIGYEISYQLGKHGAFIVIMGRRRNVLDSAVDSLRSHGIHVIYFLLLPRILFFFFFPTSLELCFCQLGLFGSYLWVSLSLLCLEWKLGSCLVSEKSVRKIDEIVSFCLLFLLLNLESNEYLVWAILYVNQDLTNKQKLI